MSVCGHFVFVPPKKGVEWWRRRLSSSSSSSSTSTSYRVECVPLAEKRSSRAIGACSDWSSDRSTGRLQISCLSAAATTGDGGRTAAGSSQPYEAVVHWAFSLSFGPPLSTRALSAKRRRMPDRLYTAHSLEQEYPLQFLASCTALLYNTVGSLPLSYTDPQDGACLCLPKALLIFRPLPFLPLHPPLAETQCFKSSVLEE